MATTRFEEGQPAPESRDSKVRREEEKAGSIFGQDVDPDELRRKAIGGYGGDSGEDVLLGASKEPLSTEKSEGKD